MAKKQARVLAGHTVGSVSIKCNQIVEGDAALIGDLEKSGIVDTDKGAVAYAKTLGDDVISIDAVQPEQAPPVA